MIPVLKAQRRELLRDVASHRREPPGPEWINLCLAHARGLEADLFDDAGRDWPARMPSSFTDSRFLVTGVYTACTSKLPKQLRGLAFGGLASTHAYHRDRNRGAQLRSMILPSPSNNSTVPRRMAL